MNQNKYNPKQPIPLPTHHKLTKNEKQKRLKKVMRKIVVRKINSINASSVNYDFINSGVKQQPVFSRMIQKKNQGRKQTLITNHLDLLRENRPNF